MAAILENKMAAKIAILAESAQKRLLDIQGQVIAHFEGNYNHYTITESFVWIIFSEISYLKKSIFSHFFHDFFVFFVKNQPIIFFTDFFLKKTLCYCVQ